MHRKYVKISTVAGSFLLVMPNGLAWFWGNVSVYVLSYIVYTHHSASSVQEPWMISTFFISWVGSLLISNVIARFVERRLLILLAIVISDSAIFMSYFTIQHSMTLLIISYSFFVGIAVGIMYGSGIFLVVSCADKDVGILCSTLQAALPSGAIIITQLVTWYCNPHNKTPKLNLGRTVYFTHKEVLDKVPSVFLVLGVFSLISHVIAFILLHFNPEFKCSIYSNSDKRESQRITEEVCQHEREDRDISEAENPSSSKDDTPKDVLKSITFYILWLSLFMNDLPLILLTNYYKLFGQIWIHDDIFLANLGTAMLVFTFIFRVAWGAGIDKFGVKFSFLCLFGSLSVLSVWYYFTARVNRWVYFIATLLYGGICSSILGCYMAATAVLFGKTHVSTNFGMIMTASIVFNSIAPIWLKSILLHLGWFFTFASGALFNLFNLILCLLFIGKGRVSQ